MADFSPDSGQLAIAAGTGVMVASAETGEIAETLRDHDGRVTAVEFRTDRRAGDRRSGRRDHHVGPRRLVGALSGDDVFVRQTAAVELDERTVALEQSDGMTQVIVAEPAAWEQRACQVAGRVLTEQEWAEILGARPYAPACRE